MKKQMNIFLAAVLGLSLLSGCANEEMKSEETKPEETVQSETAEKEEEYPVIEAGIGDISKYGNIVLTVSPQTMKELGYEEADVINVTVDDVSLQMPIGTNYSDVDTGSPICRYDMEEDTPYTILAINAGNITAALNVAEKTNTEEAPGYKWIFRDGLDESVTVYISMAEKQGYADEYEIHKVTATRTNERSDYPDLTDAQYANFREVTTQGMGKGNLYRSSSPVNPKIGRSSEADNALSLNGVHTVLNLADFEDEMKEYPGFSETYYSECKIVCLNMGMDFSEANFSEKMAQGVRFIAENKGPYLVHCLEGKDRTGFVCAVLECLCGADAKEITDDYMLTYYNFYGITEDSEAYAKIAAVIQKEMCTAFDIESLEGSDLSQCAEKYLKSIGLTDEEISNAKANLQADYGA